MKKYKLIKEYPGSPKIGTTLNYTGNGWADNNQIAVFIVESSTFLEFWEEVIEKDYEILSFIGINTIKGTLFTKEQCGHEFEEYLKNSHKTLVTIHSVKRLSDGEIFTIGDRISFISNNPCSEIANIESFYVKNDYLMTQTVSSNIGNYLSTIQKVKQPLFKTEDGVDIFEGDAYHAVNTTFFNKYGSQKAFDKKSPDLIPFWQSNGSVCKYFSIKEKAEEYILMNKPCLSVNDLTTLICITNVYKTTKSYETKLCNSILELAKLKI